MEENRHLRKAEYEQQEQFLSTRIHKVSDLIGQLKQDIDKIMDKVEIRFNELLEKMNQVLSKQDNHLIENRIQIERLREEIVQLKEQIGTNAETSESAKKPKNPMESKVSAPESAKKTKDPKQSDYKQLQNMLQSPKYVEQASNKKKVT